MGTGTTMTTVKNIFIILMLILSSGLHAQEKPKSDNWIINEVYASDKPKRYGLFLELFNSTDNKVPDDLYISDSKQNPQQARLSSKSKYTPDFRKKNYRTFRVSAVRFRRRSIRLYNTADTLYLFKRVGYEYIVKDSFPVIWNDSLSLGRCGNRICYFNIPTPGRPNQNVDPVEYMPRKNYRITVLGGISYAANAGSNGNFPSFGVRGQKITNKRLIYTATSVAIFQQGYSFSTQDSLSPILVKRTTKGHYSAIELWAGKDIGLYLTPRLDIAIGGALVLATYRQQVYDETNVIDTGGGVLEEESRSRRETLGRYDLPVITFNGGLNFQLTPKVRIETLYNILFRTFEKNETIYYQSLNIGLSYSFKHKGRGYREGLLW